MVGLHHGLLARTAYTSSSLPVGGLEAVDADGASRSPTSSGPRAPGQTQPENGTETS